MHLTNNLVTVFERFYCEIVHIYNKLYTPIMWASNLLLTVAANRLASKINIEFSPFTKRSKFVVLAVLVSLLKPYFCI